MADLGEASGGPGPPFFGEKKKKELQREEKPAGQAKKKPAPPLAHGRPVLGSYATISRG